MRNIKKLGKTKGQIIAYADDIVLVLKTGKL